VAEFSATSQFLTFQVAEFSAALVKNYVKMGGWIFSRRRFVQN